MNISFATQNIYTGKHDAVVAFTYEDRSPYEQKFNEQFENLALTARDRGEFSGKKEEMLFSLSPGNFRYAVLAGLGKKNSVKTSVVRDVVGVVARRLKKAGARHIAIELPNELDAKDLAQAVTEGVLLSTYAFSKYKSKPDKNKLTNVTIVSKRTGVAVKHGIDAGKVIAESVNLARDLQNQTPADMTPIAFSQEALKVAKQERLKSKVLDKKHLEKGGYGGIIAVGKGSENEPRLVTLEYSPKKVTKTVAIVGKGITFDTGGYSLKPSEYMLGMKFDMSGAAAVLGIIRAASQLKLPVRVIGIMGLAENSVSGTAYRPDDVVKTKSGKTIEVQNTDAEGRIVLSDALYHATTYKPDVIIDLATLTGACVVALGDICCAALGNDDSEMKAILTAGESSGELAWQLPLWDSYRRDIDSKVADMKNMGMKRSAGTISAAKLLQEFVNDTPWVHLDIAGVATAEARDAYFTKAGEGGTGFGVRLVTAYLRGISR